MPSAPRPPESPRPARAVDYIDRLALGGRYHFTTEQAAEALGLSEIAARAAIRRLEHRGVIAAPMRGFHVLVSPEHRAAGCPPADQSLPELMVLVGRPAAAEEGRHARRPLAPRDQHGRGSMKPR